MNHTRKSDRHLRARDALRPPSTKTGTLTCNVMDYRKCSINGVSYGLGSTEIGKAYARRMGRPIEPEPVAPAGAVRTPHVNFLDPAYDAHVAAGGAQLAAIADFNLHLALNHEASVRRRRRVEEDGLLLFRVLVLGFVFPLLSRPARSWGVLVAVSQLARRRERKRNACLCACVCRGLVRPCILQVQPEVHNGEIVYSASNPDEAAMVYAAKHLGWKASLRFSTRRVRIWSFNDNQHQGRRPSLPASAGSSFRTRSARSRSR